MFCLFNPGPALANQVFLGKISVCRPFLVQHLDES